MTKGHDEGGGAGATAVKDQDKESEASLPRAVLDHSRSPGLSQPSQGRTAPASCPSPNARWWVGRHLLGARARPAEYQSCELCVQPL